MSDFWWVLVPIAYLIGTFPSAHIIASASGIDIREVGSGNPGASNVIRTLGWRRGGWVLLIDMAKGAISAGVGLAVADRHAGYLLGAAAIVGHVFPLWQRFRGGKGVATGGGVFLVMSPLVFVVLTAVWFLMLQLTKKASVASIVIVVLLPICIGIVHRDVWEVFATIILCVLVMARHLGNIRRLIHRREHGLQS